MKIYLKFFIFYVIGNYEKVMKDKNYINNIKEKDKFYYFQM